MAENKMLHKQAFTKKRDAKDSESDTTKSIDAQFNLLRIVSNEEFPAFFYKNGRKYILKIYAKMYPKIKEIP